MLRFFEVSGDRALVADVAPPLLTTLRKKWIPGHRLDRCAAGACECAASRADWRARCAPDVPPCFRISDGYDAMEGSISGGGCRPSLHAAVFAEASALATLMRVVDARDAPAAGGAPRAAEGAAAVAAAPAPWGGVARRELEELAEEIRGTFLATYWEPSLAFFTVFKARRDVAAASGMKLRPSSSSPRSSRPRASRARASAARRRGRAPRRRRGAACRSSGRATGRRARAREPLGLGGRG